jgi:hypothetical protein
MIKILYESDFLGCEWGACVSCRFLHDLIHLCIHLTLAHVQRKKETISCTRLYIQDWRWIGNVSNSYPCDLISLRWFLPWYLCLYKTSCRGEMVTSPRRGVTDTYGLTSAGCHLTRLASDLGQARQKYVCTVHLWAAYDMLTFLVTVKFIIYVCQHLLSELNSFSTLNPDWFICMNRDIPWYPFFIFADGTIIYDAHSTPLRWSRVMLCIYFQDCLVLPVLLFYQWA